MGCTRVNTNSLQTHNGDRKNKEGNVSRNAERYILRGIN